jgi:hypothetical protein
MRDLIRLVRALAAAYREQARLSSADRAAAEIAADLDRLADAAERELSTSYPQSGPGG